MKLRSNHLIALETRTEKPLQKIRTASFNPERTFAAVSSETVSVAFAIQ